MHQVYLFCEKSPSTLPIAGKPVAVHIMEALVQLQITHCTLLGDEEAQKPLRTILGEGQRWGLNLDYLPQEALFAAQEETVFVGNTAALPKIQPHHLRHPQEDVSHLWFYPGQHWSGWGLFAKKQLAGVRDPYHLQGMYETLSTTPVISTRSAQCFKDSTQRALLERPLLFPATAKEVAPNVWVSCGSIIDPTATLRPPLFIGECSQIGKKAIVGPHVVVENHCLVDAGTTITDSVICPHSYVGEALQVHNCIVDKDNLLNLSLDTQLKLKDPALLSELSTLTELWERWTRA